MSVEASTPVIVYDPGVVTCSPDRWATNGTRVMAERPVRLVRFTSFPDDRAYDDTASEPDPVTGYVHFSPWPGVAFTFPPDGYIPGVWDWGDE